MEAHPPSELRGPRGLSFPGVISGVIIYGYQLHDRLSVMYMFDYDEYYYYHTQRKTKQDLC